LFQGDPAAIDVASVRETYQAELKVRGYASDPAQERAIEALDRCAREWADFKEQRSNVLKKLINRPEVPRGVYMFGGVGRGKSFLMDCFYNAVPLKRKTRLHFHEFMREVHRELAELQGTVNPLDALGERMAKRFRLICFDEFHVADITDAMILHRLLQALFDNGVGFVTTSNFKPDDLYPDGLHRDRILPAIALLNDKLHVINVDNGTDYRRRVMEHVQLYHTPLGAQADARMTEAFEQLAEARDEDPVLHIEQREIRARRKAGGVVWFDFKTLCGGPRSQNDYLEIATQFHTVLLSGVPVMPVNMASEARRFTWLVDVLYDRRVKLIMSAAVPPEALYTEGPMAHEFPRTVSRLNEMQSAEYLALERRTVNTRLT
jgi:cell division protein ZapE